MIQEFVPWSQGLDWSESTIPCAKTWHQAATCSEDFRRLESFHILSTHIHPSKWREELIWELTRQFLGARQRWIPGPGNSNTTGATSDKPSFTSGQTTEKETHQLLTQGQGLLCSIQPSHKTLAIVYRIYRQKDPALKWRSQTGKSKTVCSTGRHFVANINLVDINS